MMCVGELGTVANGLWGAGSPVPGWELNDLWLQEDSIPHEATLTVIYSSGKGLGLHRCRPNPPLRDALLSVFLAGRSGLNHSYSTHSSQSLYASSTAVTRRTSFRRNSDSRHGGGGGAPGADEENDYPQSTWGEKDEEARRVESARRVSLSTAHDLIAKLKIMWRF